MIKWINIDSDPPSYYEPVLCQSKNGSMAVCWRANDDSVEDIYTIAGTDIIMKDVVKWASLKEDYSTEYKEITGFNNGDLLEQYMKGREHEAETITKWIENWDGSTNSGMGELLTKKFKEQLFKQKLKINLNDYWWKCGDGCCDNYGTITTVNGVEMDAHNQDAYTIIKQILTHLGYNVEITQSDNGEEI